MIVDLDSTRKRLGYIFGLCFCIATALSVTMIHDTSLDFDPFSSLFYTTCFGIIYFNTTNITSTYSNHAISLQHKYLWLIISLFVAGNWLTTFFSLSKIDPFTYIFIYFSTSSVVGSCFSLTKEQRAKDLSLIAMMGSLLLFFVGRASLTHTEDASSILGLLSAISSALCGYGYRRYSVLFSQKTRLSASGVLSVRFYLLLLMAGVLVLVNGVTLMDSSVLLRFSILTCITFIVPLYCMQRSVLYIGAELFSILTALCPAATMLLQWSLYGRIDTLYLYLSATIFILSLLKLSMNKSHMNKSHSHNL